MAIQTVTADLGELDLGRERWDGIVSIFAHLPVPLRRRVHGAVKTALRAVFGRELDREIAESRYHRGQSAVVQVVARKPGRDR